jgi:hypothetical protein
MSYEPNVETLKRDEKGRVMPGYSLAVASRVKVLENTLRRAVYQSPEKLRRACDQVLDSACDGETWGERMSALTFIADRLDGKPVARIETNDTDSRNMGLADLVALVLQARKHDAIDGASHDASGTLAVPAPSDTPGGMGDIGVK